MSEQGASGRQAPAGIGDLRSGRAGRAARAGVIVTGTEVLSGRVRDRNGPWLSERLFERGIDLAHTVIVGDRPPDVRAALQFMADAGVDVVITSGGLGPTADDLTTEVVASFQGREMVLDESLRQRIAEILRPLAERYPQLDRDAIDLGNRKQATIPKGASILEPVGTAPGLVVPPAGDREGPTVVVLPGPPRELQPMWQQAIATRPWREATAGARACEQRMLRLFGIPESEIAETLRVAEREGVELAALEITTCLRGGEIEIVTCFEPEAAGAYAAFATVVGERHADTLYSTDGTTIDDQVATLLRAGAGAEVGGNASADVEGPAGEATVAAVGRAGGADTDGVESGWGRPTTIAVAESCTAGLLAARLADPPGASDYLIGGVVAYANAAKVAEVGVASESIERHGAVSEQVARELAVGIRERLGADVGVGVTGIAGPAGGSEDKPVGLVWLCVAGPEGARLTRSVRLPGGRSDVRERAVTVAMHMIRRLLRGERDRPPAQETANLLLR